MRRIKITVVKMDYNADLDESMGMESMDRACCTN